jgi:hypothetical protein
MRRAFGAGPSRQIHDSDAHHFTFGAGPLWQIHASDTNHPWVKINFLEQISICTEGRSLQAGEAWSSEISASAKGEVHTSLGQRPRNGIAKIIKGCKPAPWINPGCIIRRTAPHVF